MSSMSVPLAVIDASMDYFRTAKSGREKLDLGLMTGVSASEVYPRCAAINFDRIN